MLVTLSRVLNPYIVVLAAGHGRLRGGVWDGTPDLSAVS